ncbi:MAG: PIG-L family deacetylase [Pontixanthobacter sp.]
MPDRICLAERAATFPIATIDALVGAGRLVVVMAHPDDETLGCAMALSEAARAGHPIELVLATDGEGSHPGSAQYPRERLVELRAQELATALRELTGMDTTPITRLHLPDGRSRRADLSPTAFERLRVYFAARGVTAIWSNWTGDPHCDHITAASIAADLAQALDVPRWSCPIWGRFEMAPDDTMDGRTFYSERANPSKRRAIAAHLSQMTTLIDDDPHGFVMTAAMQDHFADSAEIFLP